MGRLLGRSDVGSIQIQVWGRSAGAPGHTEASPAGALAGFSSHKLTSVRVERLRRALVAAAPQ